MLLFSTREAEIVLVNDALETKPCSKDVYEDIVFNFQDAASFALQILAKIFSKTERVPKANEADRKALKLNPLLWNSFEALCQRGEFPDPNHVFNVDKLDDLNHCQGNNQIITYANNQIPVHLNPGGSNSGNSNVVGQSSNIAALQGQIRPSLLATPTYSYNGSSTSTPIVPVSHIQLTAGPSSNLQIPQPVIVVTPISQQIGSNNTCDSSDLDSVFTG